MDMEINSTIALGPRPNTSQPPVRQSPNSNASAVSGGNVTQVEFRAQSTPESVRAEQNGLQQKSSSTEVDSAVKDLNGYMQIVQRNLHFDVDAESGHTVVRVVDAETDEVIRQMPSEEVLALARHLKRMSEGEHEQEQGLLVREKA